MYRIQRVWRGLDIPVKLNSIKTIIIVKQYGGGREIWRRALLIVEGIVLPGRVSLKPAVI